MDTCEVSLVPVIGARSAEGNSQFFSSIFADNSVNFEAISLLEQLNGGASLGAKTTISLKLIAFLDKGVLNQNNVCDVVLFENGEVADRARYGGAFYGLTGITSLTIETTLSVVGVAYGGLLSNDGYGSGHWGIVRVLRDGRRSRSGLVDGVGWVSNRKFWGSGSDVAEDDVGKTSDDTEYYKNQRNNACLSGHFYDLLLFLSYLEVKVRPGRVSQDMVTL